MCEFHVLAWVQDLISYRLNLEETRKFIGADTLAFLPLDELHNMLGEKEAPTWCDACFSGDYPVPPDGHLAPIPEQLTGGRLLEEVEEDVEDAVDAAKEGEMVSV